MNKRKLKRIIGIPKAAFLWVKAGDCSANRDYEKANRIYDQILDYFKRNPEYHLSRSFVHFKLNNIHECEVSLERFYTLVENHERYNEDEKNYLYCYSDRILNKLKTFKRNVALQYRGDSSRLKKKNVRSTLQLSYPVEIEETFEEWLKRNR